VVVGDRGDAFVHVGGEVAVGVVGVVRGEAVVGGVGGEVVGAGGAPGLVPSKRGSPTYLCGLIPPPVAFDLASLIRPNVAQMAPYSSARDEFQGHAEVLLDANENPFDTGYNRYPDPVQTELKQQLAIKKGLSPEHLFLGNGSDEGIDLLMRAFCEPGQGAVVIQPPTYGMYEVAANLQNAPIVQVPLTAEMQPDYAALRAAATPDTRIVFFCSPNNPTGNLIDPAGIRAFAEWYHGIVVVDEAYIDFALADHPGASLLSAVRELPNLVVLQTFSKALGMAGIRLGMAWADPAIIRVLTKIKSPYNLSQLAQQAAVNALRYGELTTSLVSILNLQRASLAEAMKELESVEHVFPSDANFLLVRFTDSKAVYQHLVGRGIVTRDRSRVPGCEGCLRITVGSPDENKRLLDALISFNTIPSNGHA
jgi:histidinol-phosphate aminotransferase